MIKTKIRILGVLMILAGILLLSKTIVLRSGFLNGALTGVLIAGGLFLTATGKIKFSE